MIFTLRDIAAYFAIAVLSFTVSCGSQAETAPTRPVSAPSAAPENFAKPPQSPAASTMPNLQAEFLNDKNSTSDSPLAKFDFKNYTYPLPRGWQNPDNSDVTLTNGKLAPVSVDVTDDMDDEEKAEAKSLRRIGMSYVTTKYIDVTGDGEDEALVVLKVETAGSAIPQIVYIYDWKDDKPELIWYFRTGDRADGGLKSMRVEGGQFVVELYGQDRFLLGTTETGKITGDFEQLCCPTYFTRTYYKWNGKNFLMNKKRLTFSLAEPNQPPQENLGEIVNKKIPAKK